MKWDVTLLGANEYIPEEPSGPKNVKVWCSNCAEPKWLKDTEKLYEKASRTPIYFYSGLIITAGLILLLVIGNINAQNDKAVFVANPKIGDVYTIRKEQNDSTFYYFLRLSEIRGDSIFAYHNNLLYNGFVSQFNDDDFFSSEEELSFTKKELQGLLDKGVINAVDRVYGSSAGFNRIK